MLYISCLMNYLISPTYLSEIFVFHKRVQGTKFTYLDESYFGNIIFNCASTKVLIYIKLFSNHLQLLSCPFPKYQESVKNKKNGSDLCRLENNFIIFPWIGLLNKSNFDWIYSNNPARYYTLPDIKIY